MKKTVCILSSSFIIALSSISQTNTFPASGNVGIGTLSPAAKLSVSSNTVTAGNFSEITIDNLGSGNFYGSSIRNIYTQSTSSLNPRLTFLVQNTNTSNYAGLVERMTILGNGNVGIGLANPTTQLDVNGNFRLGVGGGAGGQAYSIAFTRAGNPQLYSSNAGGLLLGGDGSGIDLNILTNGNVLIGKTTQTNNAYRLDINGNARADKIVVNTTGADYVFDSSYELQSLDSVEHFVRTYHHLSDIPTADEMQAEGVSLGDNQILLLKKTEELTLYIIEQNKALKEQQSLIKLMKAQIDNQQAELEILKQKIK